MKNWDLSKLYESYESKKFLDDVKKVDAMLVKANAFKELFLSNKDSKTIVTDYLLLEIELNDLAERLFNFVSLKSATNTIDPESARYNVVLSKKFSEFTEVSTLFSKYVSNIKNIDEVINSSDFLKEHEFVIKEIIKYNKYNLDEKTEGLLSKLDQSSADLWSRLQGVLTSTLEIEYDGAILTLPEILGKSEDSEIVIKKTLLISAVL